MIAIENGLIVDGTGRPAFPGRVIVDGDLIVEVEEGTALAAVPSAERIDAAGCLVTPGFIDSHSHSDAYLLIEPDAPSKISQGVTTEINGQCGGSAAPRYGEARLSSDWASMRYPRLGDAGIEASGKIGPTWRSMAEYRALYDAVRPAVNTIEFVGHNTLRSSTIGYAPVRATPEKLDEMKKLLARELDDGGWGLTTGLIYQPGKYSDAAEVAALAEVAARRGGMYATHMRSEGDRILEAIDEVLELVRATGIRAEISHLKTSGRRNWGKINAVLGKIERAIEAGELAGSDRYPYCAAGTDLDVVLPDWAGEGGLAAELARLDDPALASRIAAELDSAGRDWSETTVGGVWSEGNRKYPGRTVGEIAASEGTTPGKLVCDILRSDRGRTGGFFFGMCEENLDAILSRPWIVPGSDASLRAPWGPLGDDHPHPRAYGTMPQFFRRLRKLGVGREAAIARMTSIPAGRFGIKRRGELKKGFFADIAVWDEGKFASRSDYKTPHVFADGVRAVLVNGSISYAGSASLSKGFGPGRARRSGRFLER